MKKDWMLRLLFVVVLSVRVIGLMATEYTVATVPNVRLSNRLEHVSDPDGILSAEAVNRINTLLSALEDSLGVEVAVVALGDIGEVPPRAFANELFNAWHIGKAGTDNGLLIQLVTTPGRRSVVFETGYGIEDILPDAICKRIQQRDMIPLLRGDDFSGGMVAGVQAVSDHLYAHMTHGADPVVVANIERELRLLLFCVVAAVLAVILLIGFTLWYYCWKRPKRKQELSSTNRSLDKGSRQPNLYPGYFAGSSAWIGDSYESDSYRSSWSKGWSSGWTSSSDSDSFGSSWGGGCSGGGGAESDF